MRVGMWGRGNTGRKQISGGLDVNQMVSRLSFLRATTLSGSLLKASSSAASSPFDRRGCLCFNPDTEGKGGFSWTKGHKLLSLLLEEKMRQIKVQTAFLYNNQAQKYIDNIENQHT